MGPGADTSALVLPVPAIEGAVSHWRDRFDASAAAGMPAHITAIYPFLNPSRIDPSTSKEIRALCAARSPIDATFARMGRFPAVSYLAPEPAGAIATLIQQIAQRWPETPPYGGAFEDVVPHATVAHGDEALLDSIEAEVGANLPIRTTLNELVLFVFDGRRWQPRERFPFGATPK